MHACRSCANAIRGYCKLEEISTTHRTSVDLGSGEPVRDAMLAELVLARRANRRGHRRIMTDRALLIRHWLRLQSAGEEVLLGGKCHLWSA
jgi:hypothetical protein